MTQEEIDFAHFRDKQLHYVDLATGRIDIKSGTKSPTVFKVFTDVGYLNQDGYLRVRCNGRLRMKHRFLFWLAHGYLPKEVDHDNGVRSDNSIGNLVASDRSHNTTDKAVRSYKQLTETEVHVLCTEVAHGTTNITTLAKKFGRSRAQIKGILSKRHWSEISDQYF